MNVHLEISRSNCQQICQYLAETLSNTYILYIKTQNYHWNLIDPRFHFLHKMFEEQYEELAEQVDLIAERIRTLGSKTPASMHEFLEIGTLSESEGDLTGNQMIEALLIDHEKIAGNLRGRIDSTVELGDQGTADMLIQLLKSHEKTAWMLRSHFVEE